MSEKTFPKIYIGTDHAGFQMKEELVFFLRDKGYEVVDLGAHSFNESDDYPDIIAPVAMHVGTEEDSLGIILGGSGQGEAIVANHFPGVRAVVYYGGPTEVVTLSREHNDANILSLGARFLDVGVAKEVVSLWLSTPFSGASRHVRRIEKITNLKTQ